MDIQHRILLIQLMDIQHWQWVSSLWTSSTGRVTSWLLHASRLAAGKGLNAYIPIKMASGVQVFL